MQHCHGVLQVPVTIDWRDLKDKFREAGESIVRAEINYDPAGNPKGTATVMYDNPAEAANAIGVLSLTLLAPYLSDYSIF